MWMRLSAGIIWSIYCIYYRMWYVIISWTTTIISTTQILYYKYFPSPLAQIPLIEDQEQQREQERKEKQQQQRQEGEKEERIEMQNIKNSRENKHDYNEYEYQHSEFIPFY